MAADEASNSFIQLQEALARISNTEVDVVSPAHLIKAYSSVTVFYREACDLARSLDSSDIQTYLGTQHGLLLKKFLSDLSRIEAGYRSKLLEKILLPLLQIRLSNQSDYSDDADLKWFIEVVQKLFDLLRTEQVSDLSALLSDELVLSALLKTFTEMKVSLQTLSSIFLQLDVDPVRDEDKREDFEKLFHFLMKNFKSKVLILTQMTPEKLLMLQTPFEGISEIVNCLESASKKEGELSSDQDSTDLKIELILRLFECITDARITKHLGGIVSMEELISRFYNDLMTVEVFTSSEKFLELCRALMILTSYIDSPTTCYYYFKRSLGLACLLPPHRSLWLVKYAHLLLQRNPMIIIPTFHINPSKSGVTIDPQASLDYYMKSSLPSELPPPPPSKDLIIEATHQRAAQLPCYELLLLRRHSSAAVREASMAITNFLSSEHLDSTATMRQSTEEALDVSWHRIVDGGLKRAQKRLEVSTELFSQ